MPLSAAQREARATRIGASEVAALLKGPDGRPLHRYITPRDIFDRLYGLAPPVVVNDAMRIGNELEPLIRKWAEWRGLRLWACHQAYVHPTLPLSASPDAWASPHRGLDKGLAEIKATGSWAPGIDRAPLFVRAQVQTQQMLTGRGVGWVVALQGTALNIYPEMADKEFQESILDAVATFYRDHLLVGERPPLLTFTGFRAEETEKNGK